MSIDLNDQWWIVFTSFFSCFKDNEFPLVSLLNDALTWLTLFSALHANYVLLIQLTSNQGTVYLVSNFRMPLSFSQNELIWGFTMEDDIFFPLPLTKTVPPFSDHISSRVFLILSKYRSISWNNLYLATMHAGPKEPVVLWSATIIR